MYGCQQILVSQNNDLIAILTFLCEESHKLTNMGVYYARQLYFKAKKSIGKFDLEKVYKTNNHYRVLPSQAAQQILRTVAESFKSYYGLVKAYKKGKITARIVINHCLKHNIGNIIFGWNKRNKNSINIGKKNNSEFVPIPTARLKDRIAQLSCQYGIQFVETTVVS